MLIISHQILHRVSAIAVSFIFLSISLSAASYGPVGFPKTLLTLYRESDVIAVAKFAKTERGASIREDSDFAILTTKRYFDVSYVIKGEHSKFLVVDDEDFVSKNASVSAASEPEIDDEYHILAGDTVLLFLRKSEDGKKLELVNADDSLKKLSARDLSIYEARIAELRSMYEEGQPEPRQILNWLITCVQDPATRWEGAFELVVSVERAEYQAKQAARETKPVSTASAIFDKAVLASLITEQQKHELADVLMAPRSEKSAAVRGDNELVELVAKWGDNRLPVYLIDQIRANPKPSFGLTFKVRTLLKLLDDKKAEQLASRIDESLAMSDGDDAVKWKHDAVLKFVNYAQNKLSENTPDK